MQHHYKAFVNAVSHFFNERLLTNSAALAFYAIFSLPAIIFLLVNLSDPLISAVQTDKYIFDQIGGLVGKDAASTLSAAVAKIEIEKASPLEFMVSILVLLLSATSIFNILRSSFNEILSITPQKKGWQTFVQRIIKRITSIGLLVGLTIILIISLLIDALASALSEMLTRSFQSLDWLVYLVSSLLVPILLLTLLFSYIFRVLPDTTLTIRQVVSAALVTAIFFILGKFAMGYYIGRIEPGFTYQSATAILVILVWSYFSAAIILFGCTFLKEKLDLADYEIKAQHPDLLNE